MDEQQHEWLKVPQMAELPQVARSRAYYELVANGEIPPVRIGCSVKACRKELDR